MTWPGCTSRAASRYAIRWVSTRVLPEPAPATISSGLPLWTTAVRCASFRPSTSASRSVAGGLPPPGPGRALPSSWRSGGMANIGGVAFTGGRS